MLAKRIISVPHSNENHYELRAGEEFLSNETEEGFRQFLAEGLPVRLGLDAYSPDGSKLPPEFRPVFLIQEPPATLRLV